MVLRVGNLIEACGRDVEGLDRLVCFLHFGLLPVTVGPGWPVGSCFRMQCGCISSLPSYGCIGSIMLGYGVYYEHVR